MNIESLREYCLRKKGTEECLPFDETTLVFKVGGKMFALTDTLGPLSVNLKCPTELIDELIERYDKVQPGYHMSKKHWITVLIDNRINDELVFSWIDRSYDLVVSGLPRKQQISFRD